MGVRSARPVEEESRMEGPLEESMEDSEETNLGAVQEAGMEGGLGTNLETCEETDLG